MPTSITINFDNDLLKELRTFCKAKGVSPGSALREALKKHLLISKEVDFLIESEGYRDPRIVVHLQDRGNPSRCSQVL